MRSFVSVDPVLVLQQHLTISIPRDASSEQEVYVYFW